LNETVSNVRYGLFAVDGERIDTAAERLRIPDKVCMHEGGYNN